MIRLVLGGIGLVVGLAYEFLDGVATADSYEIHRERFRKKLFVIQSSGSYVRLFLLNGTQRKGYVVGVDGDFVLLNNKKPTRIARTTYWLKPELSPIDTEYVYFENVERIEIVIR